MQDYPGSRGIKGGQGSGGDQSIRGDQVITGGQGIARSQSKRLSTHQSAKNCSMYAFVTH